MLKKNNKPLFFTLLIPFYFIILACLIGMQAGHIDWIYFSVYAISMVIAAWGLSRHNSLITNTIGLMFFVIIGAHSIYSPFTQNVHYGPWMWSIYSGIALILFGLSAFVYAFIKLKGR